MKLIWQHYDVTYSVEHEHHDLNVEEMGDAIYELLVGSWNPAQVAEIGDVIAERGRGQS